MAPSRNICDVDGCKSKKNEGISFFKLPKDEERRREWCDLIGRPDLVRSDIKFNSHVICSLHFKKLDMTNIPRLNANVLPSRCLPRTSTEENESENKDASSQTVDNRRSMITIQKPNTKSVSIQTSQSKKSSETQTTVALSSDSPRKRKLSEEVRVLRKRIRKLETELLKIKKEVQSQESEVIESFNFRTEDDIRRLRMSIVAEK